MIRVHVIQRQPYQASVHSIACFQNRDASVLPYHDQLGAQGWGHGKSYPAKKKRKEKSRAAYTHRLFEMPRLYI